MTSPGEPANSPASPLDRWLELFVLIAVITGLLALPALILASGYQPSDDGLHHVAKAVSGKTWTQILITSTNRNLELAHAGWHDFLAWTQERTGWDNDTLLSFAIFTLCCGFVLAPLPFLRRPEAWPITLLILSLNQAEFRRLFVGRPFIVSMAAVLILLLLWRHLEVARPGAILLVTASIAIATCLDTNWYLFVLPIVAYLLSRRWRAAAILGGCVAAGVILGACLTGHPVDFLRDSYLHGDSTVESTPEPAQLAGETFDGEPMLLLGAMAVVLWRRRAGPWNIEDWDNPPLLMASICWILGFRAGWYWFDWGLPALAVWLCGLIEAGLLEEHSTPPFRRAAITAFVMLGLIGIVTNNRNGRWTTNLQFVRFSANDPNMAGWLPEAGGIVYSNSATVFERMFFENPRAPWRYATGFDESVLLREDRTILAGIRQYQGQLVAFGPWARQLRPADRIVAYGFRGIRDGSLGLEWRDFRSYCIGRRQRETNATGSGPTPQTGRSAGTPAPVR